jgi:heat shock protein HslJ
LGWKRIVTTSLIGQLLTWTVVAADEPAFVDTLWRWTEFVGVDAESSLRISKPGLYTLRLLQDGRYAIRADCNAGGGRYEIEDATLTLGLSAMTLVACPPASRADRFLELLLASHTMERDGNRLVLTGADGGRMTFEEPRAVVLPGTSWLVRAYNNGKGGVVSILHGSRLTAQFSEDRQIRGSGGCNNYSATYETSEDRITIGSARSTRKACQEPKGVMEQEAAFLVALPTAHSFRFRGERLQLRTDSNALALDLVSAVTGTLRFQSGTALPSDAVVTIQIQDISRADAPARIIAETLISGENPPDPLVFEIPFDLADVDPRFAYSVATRITGSDGSLLSISTQVHPVITHGAPTHGVEVWLETVK